MPQVEPLCRSIGIKTQYISKEENIFLENQLFSLVCEELKSHFKVFHHDYFRTIKIAKKKEKLKMEENFVRFLINDILSTGQYTIAGIAYYTYTSEEVIYELATGKNTNPSSRLLRRLIELHREIKPEFYREIIAKIFIDHLKLEPSLIT